MPTVNATSRGKLEKAFLSDGSPPSLRRFLLRAPMRTSVLRSHCITLTTESPNDFKIISSVCIIGFHGYCHDHMSYDIRTIRFRAIGILALRSPNRRREETQMRTWDGTWQSRTSFTHFLLRRSTRGRTTCPAQKCLLL